MIRTELSLPELGLLAATRGMLGAGLGLLLADKLGDEQRRAVGWTLVAGSLRESHRLTARCGQRPRPQELRRPHPGEVRA